MYIFGSGVITATINNSPTPPATPLNIGLAQEISFDESYTTKTLYGQYRRPVAIGAGEIKATGKIKAARFSASVMGALLYGKPVIPGSVTTAFAEAASVPASTPFTITVVNSTTWTADQGVQDAVTGFPLTRVTATPATGQYSVAAGVYTFASADTGKAVLISYNYTTTTTGFSLAIGNPLLGPTQTFGLNVMCTDPVTNKVGTYQIYNAVIAKFAMATKLSDFAMPEYDYEAFANASNQFGQWNFPDPA
jgi:hypothetical protein